MMTIDITINGQTIKKYLVVRGPRISEWMFEYQIMSNDGSVLGVTRHKYHDGALVLARKVMESMIETGDE